MASVVWCGIVFILLISTVVNGMSIDVSPSTCSDKGTSNDLDYALGRVLDEKSNITLNLEPGMHCIRNFSSVLENLLNVTIIGNGSVNVTCTNGIGLAFYNTTDLTIENIIFDKCGAANDKINDFIDKVNTTIELFFIIPQRNENIITLLCGHCTNFRLKTVTIANTLGLGFLGINLIGESEFDDVTMTHNVPTGCYFLSRDILEAAKVGGGALLLFIDYRSPNSNPTKTAVLDIRNSHFLYNSVCSALFLIQFYSGYAENGHEPPVVLDGGGGLTLQLTQLNFTVDFTVSDSTFQNNTARLGGGASIQVYTGVYNSNILFINCSFTKNGLEGELVLDLDFITQASGISIFLDSENPISQTQGACLRNSDSMPTNITISGTTFTENRAFIAGAVSIFSLYSPGRDKSLLSFVQFDSCVFEKNEAFTGSALIVQEWKYSAAQPGLSVFLNDIQVVDNTVLKFLEVTSQQSSSGAIHVLNTNVTITGDSAIKHNDGTGFYISQGILHIDGNVSFVNNTAQYGGGLVLDTVSLLIISNNSDVNFLGNTGQIAGGGIFSNFVPASEGLRVTDCPIYFGEVNVFCFSDFSENCTNISALIINVNFEGNLSPLGNMIYGTTLDTCPWAIALKTDEARDRNILEILYENQQEGRHTPMTFDRAPNTTEAVATPALKLVVSNSTNETIDAIPGHPFTLHITALDRFNRSSISIITSIRTRDDAPQYGNRTSLGNTNYWFLEGNMDSDTLSVPLSVFGTPSDKEFNVTLLSINSYAQQNILVRLVDCPPGFVFEPIHRECVCDDRLENFRVICNADSSLTVPTDEWIGYGYNSSELVATYCHFDYCVGQDKNTSAGNFSSQCNNGYNRGGVGCGGCKAGYGLMFGTNVCEKCGNYSLFLIILFAFVGILIISCLSFFQTTISNGYLNGVLFYANIITLFYPVFTARATYGTSFSGLFVFFAWLNLDIGISTCFYANMTALERSALSFVFPFYLYVLMGLIVILAKYSEKFANRFNKNSFSATKLFATLFVMTYTNLFRNCVEVLGIESVKDLNGTDSYIWRSDANQPYFQGGHIPLCLLAISVLVIYIIPAPFVLMFPGAVMRVKFLSKYKPLYDAFWAPFKPNFRFWIGLRLILRVLPLVFTYFVPTPLNVLFLGVFLLILIYVQGVLQPFEGKGRNASDLFFLGNLAALMMGTLYFYVFFYNSRTLSAGSSNTANEVQMLQALYYGVFVTFAYIVLTILSICKLFVRFPILQYYLWKALTTVCFCKICAKWMPKGPKYESILRKKSQTKQYGATSSEDAVVREPTSTTVDISYDEQDEDSPVRGRKAIVNYSELREPLLDSSGSVELENRHTA